MPRYCAVKVVFRRTEQSKPELGVGVGEEPSSLSVVIDANGQVVPSDPQIYDFKPLVGTGLMWFDLSKRDVVG